MLRFNFGVFLAFLCFGFWTGPGLCAEPIPLSELVPGSDYRTFVSAQASAEFTLSILRREQAGKTEVVVLLGEAHAKSPQASELGRALLAGFNGDFGVEGVDFDSYFMGPQIGFLIHAIHKVIQHGVFGAQGKPSTILDAVDMGTGVSEGGRRNIQKVVYLESGHQPDVLENATLVFLAVAAARFGGELIFRVGQAGFWVVRQSPADLARGAVGLPLHALSALWRIPVGAVQSLASVPQTCRNAILFLSGKAAPKDSEAEKDKEPVGAWSRLASTTNGLFNGAFLTIVGTNVWAYINPRFAWGIIGNRNRTMVETGVSHLEQQPSARPLLVIAGAAHKRGLEALLEDRGFERVEWVAD